MKHHACLAGSVRPALPLLTRRTSFCLAVLLLLSDAGEALADPPVITVDLPPSPLLVGSNTTVTLSVSALQSSVPTNTPLAFEWRRNGAVIPGTLVSFFTNSVTTTYTITNIEPAEGGAYSVVVFNTDGTADSQVVDVVVSNTPALQGADDFGDRVLIDGNLYGNAFSLLANNTDATSEPGEPAHGNVPAEKSIWYVWVPGPEQAGVWVIDTLGSDFDTTMSVYKDPGLSVTNVLVLDSYEATSYQNDDANYPNNYHNSSVTLNVKAGQTNAIAIDGFYGASGDIILNFTKINADAPVAKILVQPHSQSVPPGASLPLNFVTDSNGYGSAQWLLNGVPVFTNFPSSGNTNGTLILSNLTSAAVGQYQVLVYGSTGDTNGILSDPAYIQIDAVDGSYNPAAFALPKFLEEASTGYIPLVKPLDVAVSGYTGTHIWNTYGAEAEPGEPDHCNEAGGAPFWFAYAAPDTGTLTVSATTPTFTNILAIYTWPGGDFSDLVPVACATTNAGTGQEVTVFPVENGTTYYIVVDGLEAGTGLVTLDYNLITPPVITTQPQSQTVALGSNVTVTVAATGVPAPAYQWYTNQVSEGQQENPSLTVNNFQSGNQGAYNVVVTNLAGSVTSSVAMLYLNSPLRFINPALTNHGSFTASLLGIATTNYVIQAATNLPQAVWIPILTNNAPYGIISFVDTNVSGYSNRFFRAAPH
jgi:hypothetical protein